jgi:DNA-binding MarR family transcriptional regulator
MNEGLKERLLERFISMKNLQFQNMICMDGLTFSEKRILFIIYKKMKNDKISLSVIREALNLAPSTITPLITLLERKKLIKREIDKEDRRNIYLKITKEGKEYSIKSYEQMNETMDQYIKFMGEKDISRLIDLLSKTIDFFKNRNEEL